MCFICSQATGFETDLATIIGKSETPKLDVNQTGISLPENGNAFVINLLEEVNPL